MSVFLKNEDIKPTDPELSKTLKMIVVSVREGTPGKPIDEPLAGIVLQ